MGRRRSRRSPRYRQQENLSDWLASQPRPWRYVGAIDVDRSHCIPATPDRQHFTVVAETAYYSMQRRCEDCAELFWFSAREQWIWYERWGFWIDSVPNQCAECRKRRRQAHGRL
jgi:hypothetical protein